MRRLILAASLALLAAPLALPNSADAASCSSRKLNGTVIGGLGGVLLGGAVTHGSTGPIVGGLGGAVVGHEIGRSGCRYRSSSRSYRAPARAVAPAPVYAAPRAQPVYYDQYGRPVAAQAAYAGNGACRTELHRYYNERGALVQRDVQVCSR